jgi:hypothetical protein
MEMNAQPDAAVVRSQLESLRSSAVFSRSARLCELLKFLVEETIDGRGHTLKELVVGEAIYGRNAPYDPCIDSTVRVEARRLRRKLVEYYEGPGYDAPFRIVLPGGGYRPIFEQNERLFTSSQFGSNCPDGIVDLAIMPFRALSSSHLNGQFADGLTDELIYLLDRASSLRPCTAARRFSVHWRQLQPSRCGKHAQHPCYAPRHPARAAYPHKT